MPHQHPPVVCNNSGTPSRSIDGAFLPGNGSSYLPRLLESQSSPAESSRGRARVTERNDIFLLQSQAIVSFGSSIHDQHPFEYVSVTPRRRSPAADVSLSESDERRRRLIDIVNAALEVLEEPLTTKDTDDNDPAMTTALAQESA